MGPEGYAPAPDPDATANIIGGSQRVVEHLSQTRDADIRNLMLTNRGLMSPENTSESLRLFSEPVMPHFRD